MLHDVIDQAAKASSIDSKYISAAVALLSNPLQDDIGIPAEAQNLFIRLFDHAAEDPSLENIRRIYRMLQGTSSNLLSLLSTTSLLHLEEHLFLILRNIKGENQSLSLYCLAIMRAMCSASMDSFSFSSSQYDTQELLASTQLAPSSAWTPEAIRQFFTDSKAQKTMQLVVLRAMWACTTSTGEPFDERMESLRLANEVVNAVPPHLREVWRKANSLILGKLQDKALVPELEDDLRFQALCFLMQVTEGGRIPPTVMDKMRGLVVVPKQVREALSSITAIEMECLTHAGTFDQNATTLFMQNVVDFTTSSNDEYWLENTKCIRRILQELYTFMSNDEKVTEGVMLALDVIACGQKLRRLANLTAIRKSYSTAEDGGRTCEGAMHAVTNGLVHDLCKVFLRAALSSPHQSYSASQDTISMLLDLHAASALSPEECSHSRSQSVSQNNVRITFVEAASSPENAVADWRQTLHEHLSSRATNEEQKLGVFFAKACADLEARCEDVERPLQEQRNMYTTLQHRFEEMERAYSTLESENIDLGLRFDALQSEKAQCIEDLDAQREEIETHERRIEELLQTLQQAREDSERLLAQSKNATDAASLEHAAAFARKEEELEELQERLQHSEQQTLIKVADMNSLREEIEVERASKRDATAKFHDAQRANEDQRLRIIQMEQQHDDNAVREAKIQAELLAAQNQVQAERESHLQDIEETRRNAESDLAAAGVEREQKLAEATRQFEASNEEHQHQVAGLQQEALEAREQHRSEIEQWETNADEKQRKVSVVSLRRKRCSY